ncbi:MAG: sigma-70 family RNA polymerase sigma factor [Deltaproteobacteria bacterium]|nr:sigma-70 family RNA polymerase sigma factor [Deltaproteobacteria bacterium]
MTLPVLTDSIQNYLTEINRFPLLSQDEELRISKRYYKARGLEDAHTLVTSNLRYVVKVAFEFRSYGCRMADLIQEGNIGLMHAVKKFNPLKGFRLITYATWWIRSSIQEFILRTKGIVRRNSRALKKHLFYKNDPSTVKETEAFNAMNDVSLNAPVNDGSATHIDILMDERPGPMLALEESRNDADVKKGVASALAILNPKERLIIEKRVMADEPESLQGLGAELGLTRERVRQIESAAIKKLRACLSPVQDGGRTSPEPA